MAPVQARICSAIGLLKDQTSIFIAKAASASTPALEVAIVKATSHSEVSSEERHVQAVLHLTSSSPTYVNACVCNIARRVRKTHNWVVAIKALILTHRLLRDGVTAFEKEIILSCRQGIHVLHVADFRDKSHVNGWDFSAFVRAYGLYLDCRLDCSSLGSFGARRRASCKDSRYDYSDSVHHSDGYGSPCNDTEMTHSEKGNSRSFKDMKLRELIKSLPAFQRLLGRVLACRPTGPAKVHELVSVALYAVVRESFVLYADLRDGLAILNDAFFDLNLEDCGGVLDIYILAAKQMDDLISFYSFCKALGVCQTAQYPRVDAISKDLLFEMENFVHEGGQNRRNKISKPMPQSPQKESKRGTIDMDALPAPAEESPAPEVGTMKTLTEVFNKGNPDLVSIEEPTMSLQEIGDKLALALCSGTQTNGEAKWEAFLEHRGSVTMAAANTGVAGWELALIESESELDKPNGNPLAGSFDHLLLESLYDQGADRHNNLLVMGSAGSPSSVALSGRTESNMSALRAPLSNAASYLNDPFAASKDVPNPAYVQMSEMWQKQQLLVQEQQQWLRYQQGEMYLTNPFVSPYQPGPYAVSYQGSNNPYYS